MITFNDEDDIIVWNNYAQEAFKELLKQDKPTELQLDARNDPPTLTSPKDLAELVGMYADAMLTEERKRRIENANKNQTS